ncbi:MAG: DEAD/DEAH box helicase [Gammaproteobacteria bacterium]|nr:DEAD/DEAH box helicase [Gammaproteobacteria bacterium]
MRYTLEDLNSQFSAHLLDGAGLYLEAGRVAVPDVRQDGGLITSLVEFPGQRPYRVYIRVENGMGRPVGIRGECSACGRGNCEHVAAVLLRAIEGEEGLVGEDLELVLQGVLPQVSARNHYPPGVDQRLLYMLHPDEQQAVGLPVSTGSARLLSSGRLEGVRDYEPAWAMRGRPPRFLLDTDIQILSELSNLAPGASGRRSLKGGVGEQLFTRMLQSGRCYLGQAETLLGPGAKRQGGLKWRIDSQGIQHPRFTVDLPVDLIFQLEGLWYVDSGTGECGRLEASLPDELSTELIELTAGIEPEQVLAFNGMVDERFPSAEVSRPVGIPVVEQEPVKPVACLHFTSRVSSSPDEMEYQELLSLSFDYGGVCFRDGRTRQRFDGNRVLRVQRRHGFEKACVARLLSSGFRREPEVNRDSSGDCFLFHGKVDTWFEFQLGLLVQLRQEGWQVEFDSVFPHRLMQVDSWHGRLQPQGKHDWFSLSLGIEVAGKYVNLLPALVTWLRGGSQAYQRVGGAGGSLIVPLEEGGSVPIPFSRVQHILDTLFELAQRGVLDGEGHLPLSRTQLARLAELAEEDDGAPVSWSGEEDPLIWAERLRGVDQVPNVPVPEGLKANLRDYQQQGLDWLQFLREYRLAGVLADDMGLGKTVQALAHLLLEREQGRMDLPSLVVAPTSLMVNWRREARQFAPELRVLLLHGPERHKRFREIPEYDLVLTSYPLLARDIDRWVEQQFHLLILDEAQFIKNTKTRTSRSVREINARHRVCLTGTPMENHLGELWSLFDFLMPGLLGGEKQFYRTMREPIEKQGDEVVAERLAKRVRPFLLRRTKQEVAQELPPRTDMIRGVALAGEQRELYESVRLAMHEQVRDAIAESGLGRSHIMVLDALLKLRQVCCDPRLVKLEEARQVNGSAKLELLMDMLPEMIEEGRRVLLFSQFTSMLELIGTEVAAAGIDYVKLTGRTRNRAIPVDRFQNGEVPLFLISLKAGGTGLNLTAADTVIHYDPWWNPAVERQAADRAHRIGQKNPVFVYKLICEGTVEEKIQMMQVYKQALADSLFSQREGSGPRWSEEDLDSLFEPLE